jgi:SOS-response transcriptional repressor LexA
VHAHLANLERVGLIKRDPTKPRALELRRDPKPQGRRPAREDVHRLPLVGEIAAGGRCWPSRTSRTTSRCPSRSRAGATSSCCA